MLLFFALYGLSVNQGWYRSWKTCKVMEFKHFIFQAWEVMEFNCWSSLESHGQSKFCFVIDKLLQMPRQ